MLDRADCQARLARAPRHACAAKSQEFLLSGSTECRAGVLCCYLSAPGNTRRNNSSNSCHLPVACQKPCLLLSDLQAVEKDELSSRAKGDVVASLLPLVDNFELARTQVKAETEGEQKINNSYQVQVVQQRLCFVEGCKQHSCVGRGSKPLDVTSYLSRRLPFSNRLADCCKH